MAKVDDGAVYTLRETDDAMLGGFVKRIDLIEGSTKRKCNSPCSGSMSCHLAATNHYYAKALGNINDYLESIYVKTEQLLDNIKNKLI